VDVCGIAGPRFTRHAGFARGYAFFAAAAFARRRLASLD
jgi:hypothetical protein